MIEHEVVDSSFTAIINAPIEKVDLPKWCFTLPEHEYRGCSPAHVAAGFATSPDSRRMSINVEVIGGVPMVQHYVEKVGRKTISCSSQFPTSSRRRAARRSTCCGR